MSLDRTAELISTDNLKTAQRYIEEVNLAARICISILRFVILSGLLLQVSCASTGNNSPRALSRQDALFDICELAQIKLPNDERVWVSGHYVAGLVDPPTLESWRCHGFYIFVFRGGITQEKYDEFLGNVNLNAELLSDSYSRLPVIFHGTLSVVPGGSVYILRYDDVIIVK